MQLVNDCITAFIQLVAQFRDTSLALQLALNLLIVALIVALLVRLRHGNKD